MWPGKRLERERLDLSYSTQKVDILSMEDKSLEDTLRSDDDF